MNPVLRPYQEKLLADIDQAWLAGYRRPLIVLPTGGGKTIVFAEAIRREAAQHRKALAIAHRREIIGQTSRKLHDAGVVAGIVMAGAKPRSTLDVQVASVQTLFARGIKREVMSMPPADLGVIDEAHHTPAASYQKIVEAYPETRWLGFTATPERGDGRQVLYGVSAELQRLLEQHDGLSRSVPTRANSVLIEHDVSGSSHCTNGGDNGGGELH